MLARQKSCAKVVGFADYSALARAGVMSEEKRKVRQTKMFKALDEFAKNKS
jgi:hypothetical protein